jgi:cyclopropane fatty-acyl-phospholipid synthase-like methyltransferase
MRTNVPEWQALQEGEYFKHHKYYQGGDFENGFDQGIIPKYLTLGPEMTALVIGAGYGRDTVFIARAVKEVYCIDVKSEKLEALRAAYLQRKGITNYKNLAYQPGWDTQLPPLDFAYCFTVFQHITRDITTDYFRGIAAKLKDTGRVLFQFCQCLEGGQADVQPGLIYEPQVNWSRTDIENATAAAGFRILSLDTTAPIYQNKLTFLWHWLLAGRK